MLQSQQSSGQAVIVGSKDNITDNDILIPNYVCVRHDRNRHGGGILLYIKSCFQYKILVKGPSNLELLFVSINQGPTIGVFYRLPSSPSIVMDTLFNILSSFDIHVFSNLVLLGDFNIDTLSPSHYLYHHLGGAN